MSSSSGETARLSRLWRDVSDECRKSTWDVTVTHVQITLEDGRVELVGCSAAFHNDSRLNGD